MTENSYERNGDYDQGPRTRPLASFAAPFLFLSWGVLTAFPVFLFLNAEPVAFVWTLHSVIAIVNEVSSVLAVRCASSRVSEIANDDVWLDPSSIQIQTETRMGNESLARD